MQLKHAAFLVVAVLLSSSALAGTNLLLDDADEEVMEDTYVNQNQPTTNFGTAVQILARGVSGSVGSSLIKFNISSIPASQQIDSAIFRIVVENNLLEAGESLNITLRHVFANYTCDNAQWVETCPTYDKRPHGNSTNITVANWTVIPNSAAVGSTWEFNVTDIVQVAYDMGFQNVTLGVSAVAIGSQSGDDRIQFDSKESATSSERPLLNITYSDAPSGNSCTAPGVAANWNIDCSTDCDIDFNQDMAGRNVSITGSGTVTMTHNVTDVTNFYLASSCNLYMYSGAQIRP